ncbi:uncharacterized protein BDR25DRAFT_352905 [Lindgomyces ingoldianus]|uniref:Uncharacterized protein n=1 Tax=Lindgomyces ingoldianus TaxID=673940 RepID=A0ACB6R2K2_9PLEO|nr:uncharacterized protein BDR25DRAFT_352905 [Lindgomyces ingoldianus]KAF2473488.1 hypothetical protein BDR25DRAFT_352905 [Lindgomyces ingoldianus]
MPSKCQPREASFGCTIAYAQFELVSIDKELVKSHLIFYFVAYSKIEAPIKVPTLDILAAQIQDPPGEKVREVEDMAFIFDIDGVLVHGDRLIPKGKRKARVAPSAALSKILHSLIPTDQFIQSHMPMRASGEFYKIVLLVEYGFEDIFAP